MSVTNGSEQTNGSTAFLSAVLNPRPQPKGPSLFLEDELVPDWTKVKADGTAMMRKLTPSELVDYNGQITADHNAKMAAQKVAPSVGASFQDLMAALTGVAPETETFTKMATTDAMLAGQPNPPVRAGGAFGLFAPAPQAPVDAGSKEEKMPGQPGFRSPGLGNV